MILLLIIYRISHNGLKLNKLNAYSLVISLVHLNEFCQSVHFEIKFLLVFYEPINCFK